MKNKISKEKIIKESPQIEKMLDEMEWKRIYRERYQERFTPRADFNPDDEDLSDKRDLRFRKIKV